MINKLLSELESALRVLQRDPSNKGLQRTYEGRLRRFNQYGQQSLFVIEFEWQYMFLNVDNIQDAKDIVRLQFPDREVISIYPVGCKHFYDKGIPLQKGATQIW